MARLSNQLTNLQVQRAKCPEGSPKKLYKDGNGLYLQVNADNAKYWTIRVMVRGKNYWRGLGTYPTLSLGEARVASQDYIKALKNNEDPLVEKRKSNRFEAIPNNITFDRAFKNWCLAYDHEWSDKHKERTISIYNNYVKSIFGDLPLTEITDAMCLQELAKINKQRSSTAIKAKSLMSSTFNNARDDRTFTGFNPLEALRNNRLLKKKAPSHHKAIADESLAVFLGRLQDYPNEILKVFLYVIYVTGLRVGSLRLAKWSWLNMDKGLLSIPPEHMKNRKAFVTPIPKRALSYLKDIKKYSSAIRGDDPYIFFGRDKDGAISNNAPRLALRQLMGDEVTVHGFRTLLNRLLTRTRKYSTEIIEAQLSHANENRIRTVYLGGEDFLPERIKMVQDYEDMGLSELNQQKEEFKVAS